MAGCSIRFFYPVIGFIAGCTIASTVTKSFLTSEASHRPSQLPSTVHVTRTFNPTFATSPEKINGQSYWRITNLINEDPTRPCYRITSPDDIDIISATDCPNTIPYPIAPLTRITEPTEPSVLGGQYDLELFAANDPTIREQIKVHYLIEIVSTP